MGHRAFATSDTSVPTAPRDVATGVAVALPARAVVAAPAATELEAAADATAQGLAAELA
ncbi:MAG: hypothetical protein HY908_37835, partial [Myxococcales bacterium]|nr:hypothetical protein [Myxococcales bacterium]